MGAYHSLFSDGFRMVAVSAVSIFLDKRGAKTSGVSGFHPWALPLDGRMRRGVCLTIVSSPSLPSCQICDCPPESLATTLAEAPQIHIEANCPHGRTLLPTISPLPRNAWDTKRPPPS